MNNRRSWSFSLEPFAGVGVAYRHREEAQTEGQHDDVQHEMLLAALVFGCDRCTVPARQIAVDQNNKRLIACDRQVPRWVYVFEMDVMATL